MIVFHMVIGVSFLFANELPNTFSVANPKCLEAVAKGQEPEVLPPVKTEKVDEDQNNLVARVVKTVKKSWQQDFDMLKGGEKVVYEPGRSHNQQTTAGIKMKSLEPPGDSNDFARLTHELCHSIGNKGQGYQNYGEQLDKSCNIGSYGSMTPAEAARVWPDSSREPATIAFNEHFAEVCTLFLLNPKRLKAECADGYDKMSKVFGGPSKSSCNDETPPPVFMAKSANVGASSGGSILPLGLLGLPFLLAPGGTPKPVPPAPATAPTGKLGEAPVVAPKPPPVAVSTAPRVPLKFGLPGTQ